MAFFYDRRISAGKHASQSAVACSGDRIPWHLFIFFSAFAGKEACQRNGIFSGGSATKRGFFALCVLCGFTIFGVPLTVGGHSHRPGNRNASHHVCSSVWNCRGSGGDGTLFPQFVVYLPAYVYLMEMVYKAIGDLKTRGFFRKKRRVFSAVSAFAWGIFWGILLETVLNPFVVEN